MHSMRRGHDAAFKAKVALEAVKGEKTIAQLSSEFGVHGNQVRQWRQQWGGVHHFPPFALFIYLYTRGKRFSTQWKPFGKKEKITSTF